MRIGRRMSFVLIGLMLTAAACGGSDDPGLVATPPADGTDSEAEGQDAQQKSLAFSEAGDLGQILTIDGMTLYVFMKDEGGTPSCTGQCASIWPPLETGDGIAFGEGVDEALVGSVTGSEHVTYNGRPLYFYSMDENPGDTNGQGVGDNWFVVGPNGDPIKS